MICPNCKSRLWSRLTLQHPNGRLFRQRRCKGCAKTFYTEETIIDDSDKVIEDIRLIYKMRKAGWNSTKQEKTET